MFKTLFSYFGKYKIFLLVCFVLVLSEVLCEMMIPKLMAKIVDQGITTGDHHLILTTGLTMIGLALLGIGFGVANMWFSAQVSQGFAANIRQALFNKIQTFSFANLDQFNQASLITRITNDVSQLQMAVMMSLRMLLRAPLMLISAMFFALTINLQLSQIIFFSVPLLILAIFIIIKRAERLFSTMQTRLDRLNTRLRENLIGIRIVKSFVREPFETRKFAAVNQDLSHAAVDAGNLVSLIMPLMIIVLNGATIAVMWLGGRMVGEHLIGTGTLVSFISYLMQILMSVMFFSMIFIMIARAEASVKRIVEVLTAKIDIADLPETRKHRVVRGSITFDHVHFRYPGAQGKDVLSDISLTINPGEIVGLVGGTGSGKTTLVNLIPRLFDVTQGSLSVDGLNVRNYRLTDLRSRIGMVLQKNVLFSGTIKQNLLWGNQSATMSQIEQACRIAAAHDFIRRLPQGYDTDLNQGGVNLSGGQRQRLCIARALLKQPAILILDDSTSAVDVATEADIQQAFRSQLTDCTIILIAQRISSVKDADKIIVLDNGKISGLGSHQELLKTNQVYQEIYASQNNPGLGD